ncbi:PrsW family glutamic-type intramembrane protease [Marispirochaeta sp.]|uniref:PrsW family intramembrane metalloprotease n=1 Tax=Marispirochaeta sp. TaxID=2038653 RepID=UPI0029C8D8FB|nr:PrsW family glutamic-type intramembrane protease [Marispirochaeta sp.]
MSIIPLIMAIVPSLVLVALFMRFDRSRPEPKGEILRAFMLGVFATFPALVLELIADNFFSPWFSNPFYLAILEAFVIAALSEEWIKLMVVRYFLYRRSHFDEVMDGIVYTVAAGLGFACLENIIYVASGGITVALTRAFTAVPLHAVCSALLGYALGMARFAPTADEEQRLITGGLFLAVFIHGIYNFLLFMVPLWGAFSALGVFPVLIIAARMVRDRLRRAQMLDRRRRH